jgi:hypothetical protein
VITLLHEASASTGFLGMARFLGILWHAIVVATVRWALWFSIGIPFFCSVNH